VSALLLVLAVGVAAIETINYYVMDVISPTLFLGSSRITAYASIPLKARSASPAARPANSRSLITAAWSR
jgi:hypothetical protein